jgi:hypothetical protein
MAVVPLDSNQLVCVGSSKRNSRIAIVGPLSLWEIYINIRYWSISYVIQLANGMDAYINVYLIFNRTIHVLYVDLTLNLILLFIDEWKEEKTYVPKCRTISQQLTGIQRVQWLNKDECLFLHLFLQYTFYVHIYTIQYPFLSTPSLTVLCRLATASRYYDRILLRNNLKLRINPKI